MTGFSFEGIGTHWDISIEDTDSSRLKHVETEVIRLVEDFDRYFSRFKADSFVTSLKQQKGLIEVREEFVDLLWHYLPWYHLTGGKVTPLVGELLEEAGYDAAYSFKTSELHTPPQLPDVVEIVDPKHIRLHQPALFDFGAAGKGYLVDLVANYLKGKGCTEFTVDAGGDICRISQSGKPIIIGLEDPSDTSKVIGKIPVLNQAICGSAGNRRTWGEYHHIIDPITKESPTDIIATWTLAERGALADGLSTCLFFIDPARLLTQFRFEYVILYKNYSIRYSDAFKTAFE